VGTLLNHSGRSLQWLRKDFLRKEERGTRKSKINKSTNQQIENQKSTNQQIENQQINQSTND
jgi:hypothetical protein